MRPPSAFLLLLALAASFLVGGCASRPPATEPLTLVYLKTGPTTDLPPDQRATAFKGHFSNMKRLADEGHLLIGGPFDKPHDPTWRGLFLFTVPTTDEPLALTATDPAVQAGIFTAQARPLAVPPSIRRAPEFERDLLAKNPSDPANPAANIRKYVIIHAPDHAALTAALSKENLRTIWSGRFTDTPGSSGGAQAAGAVAVIDADDPAAFQARLEAAGVPATVDAWWSTRSLERFLEAPQSKSAL